MERDGVPEHQPRFDATRLYYECHVTVEPVTGDKLDRFKHAAESYGFRVADLLMRKRDESSEQRSDKDSFCTARGKSYRDLYRRTRELVFALHGLGFKVWRYKIEDTVIDSRHGDDRIFRELATHTNVTA